MNPPLTNCLVKGLSSCVKTMAADTLQQFDTVIGKCRTIFDKKTKDYGTAWRILRPASLTDQIFIKAQRVRTIEDKGTQKVNEDPQSEFIGMANYCLMALIQLDFASENKSLELGEQELELGHAEALRLYDEKLAIVRELLVQKNHDYGDAWRSMRVSSFTDLILMKLLRIKQIEDNAGKTLISEGIDSGYCDILNYAVFALIQSGMADEKL